MSDFKPGDKVYIIAEYERPTPKGAAVRWEGCDFGSALGHVPLSSIHRNPTEELERLRAYVELMPCMCQRGLVKLCDRCKALGKEKS